MAWETLKNDIAQTIKTNGNQEITGLVLQQELYRIIDVLGSEILGRSAWASYVDTVYSSANTPFASATTFFVAAGTTVKVPNNGGFVINSQLSPDIGTFWDIPSQKITGREGDNLDLMAYWKAQPLGQNAELDIWIDIGGSVGELYRETQYFRGANETKGVKYDLSSAYTLDTWQANGGELYMKPSVDMHFWGFNFNFDRSHKALG